MSFQVLITGKLTQNPQLKTSKNGNPYTWMLLSIPTEQERTSASVLGFDSSVIEMMKKLSSGDEIAVTGTANINQWEKDDGTVRVSLNVIASQVMTMYYHRKKKKRFVEESPAPVATGEEDFDDDISSV
ncbi:MAG: Unknown protein [uncultured Thiotrichaceae bacterium]|uniref:Single-stranded DNA-binding protein n=1 Tax=uncultured Thiotrichaceae bacterium TaxID=298394 RepID=A0A6S6UA67_9GAMM|nr:MAG: Unknown protein [uncultured Thiotrichaceae bacterium]